MKGSGPRYERETTITFNEDSDIAEIWTASEVVYRRLMKRLGPTCLVEDGQRHATFSCPKNLVKLPLLRKVSPERTKAQVEAGKRLGARMATAQNAADEKI